MSRLILCDLEVGGQPYRMAEILNRHGVPTWYLSLGGPAAGHDSTRYHYGESQAPWDLSGRIGGRGARGIVRALRQGRRELGIRSAMATGARACLLRQAGIPYRYWSYGSDLDQQAFGPLWPVGYPAWRRPQAWIRFALDTRRLQRRSLREAEAVLISPYQRPVLDRIRPGAPLFFVPHVMPVGEWQGLRERAAADAQELGARIGATAFVFSAVRHVWAGALAALPDNKGNDVAIRAFAAGLWGDAARGVKLVLVSKGPDVAASAQLIRELGIAERVVWLEEMPREDLFRWYRGAALCLGQFGTPALNFSVVEPLSQATPCLSYELPPHPGVPWYPTPAPGRVGRDPGELGREIARLLRDPAALAALARESWCWAREHCSEERFVERFRTLFP